MSVLTKRLKEARLRADLSQERLGVLAGLDEMSASTRMNRYEVGQRIPTPDLVEKFGDVLGLPSAYFYAVDDALAELIATFGTLSAQNKLQLIKHAAELRSSQDRN